MASKILEGEKRILNSRIPHFIQISDPKLKRNRSNKTPSIPTRPTPSDPNRHLADWDCASAIDIPFLTRTLQHIQSHASLPSDLLSKEDQNSVGESGVPDSTVSRLRAEADSWRREMSKGESDFETLTIALIDGFLLYAPSPLDMPDHPASEIHDVTSQLTIRLLLRAKHARVKARREARAGYVTLDGFWTDPEGYVDEIVWPGYLRDCGWLFEEGDVEVGGVTELARRMRIRMVPGEGEWGMEKLLVWAFEEVKGGVEGVLVKE